MEFKLNHITRKNLDVAKYDACILKAINSRIYAYSWYLDAVADHWDVLVYGDYEIVMPLPWRKKYFIHYIYTPSWIQQLGIFFTEKIDDVLLNVFLTSIPKKFKKTSLMLNSLNESNSLNLIKRNNYILNLNEEYKFIFDNYKKNRKQSLKESTQFQTTISVENNLEVIIKLHQSEIANRTNISSHDYENLRKLFDVLEFGKDKFIYNCIFENEIIGSAIFLHQNKRYYYLMSAVNENGKKMQAMSLILNQFIKDHANENAILDFEGSMISGIASFFKSFGTEIENYYFYQKSFKII